jgi:hypothetical protein
MIMENLNNVQNNQYNNYSKSLKNIYRKLIEEFESHLLPENKKLAMFDYLKNNCDINFSNDVILILEDFNSIISQAIQAIRSLLSENERLVESKNLINNISDYYNKVNNNENFSAHNLNNGNNNYNYDYTNFSHNNNNNNNLNNYNYDYSNNNNFNDFNYSNNNTFNNENKKEKENIQNPLNFKYGKNMEMINNEPLKKPIREQLKKMAKENPNNNIQNLNNFSNSSKNSLRMVLNGQIPINENNKTNENNINNNNINEMISLTKRREMEILKVTNEILKLIEIANEKKNYLVEKYINSSSNNYESDYKEFIDRIINYKYDILTLNNILKDLNDFSSIIPNLQLNKKKENKSYSKEKVKNPIIENNNFYENNEDFKNNLRKYSSNNSVNKKPFINATNPYGHLFS